jgi:3-oxoadipate enol-lactonase / 4-carboxymuconolactone decarboxylase
MAFTDIQGTRHFYRHEGAPNRPVLVLSHSLGLDHGTWDTQVADFLHHCQVLRYDTRGHGASGATSGDYSIEQLARDALAIVDAAGVGRFAWCGLSLGGMIGQWLAVNVPDRITHLVLANTSPRLSDPTVMETRRRTVLDGGMTAVADMVMGRFFSPAKLQANGPAVASTRRTLLSTNPIGYAGCCAAIRDMDQTQIISAIRTPTLVISGDLDVATPWVQHGDVLTGSIPGARAIRLPAAHLSNVERPRSFTTAILEFLLPAADGSRDSGHAVRKDVLGAAHVERSARSATDLTRDFQEFVTRVPWGMIWTRPGLDRRTRRLLVLSTTAALGRWEEFRLHLNSGLAADLEPCDVKEVLLQVAAYAGVPAANTAFQIAAEEVDALEGT